MSTGLAKRLELEMRGRPVDQILDLNLDNCRANKIEGEGLTSDFTSLQTLSLINLGLISLEGFPKLGSLRKLELSDNKIAGGLNYLTCCPNLTHLSLSGNKIKDIAVLEPLKDLHFLKSLDLFNCEVTNNEQYREKVFETLKQLVYLDGFDKEEKEQEDVDGEDDDDDDDDDEDDDENEDDEDDDDEDEVGLDYLTRKIDDDDDEEDEEDFDPDELEEDEDVCPIADDLSDDDDDEDGVDDDDDDDDEEEDEDADDSTSRGTKRKHEGEEEGDDDDA